MQCRMAIINKGKIGFTFFYQMDKHKQFVRTSAVDQSSDSEENLRKLKLQKQDFWVLQEEHGAKSMKC